MRALLPIAVFVLTSGCKVVDAPDSIEELVVFGFVAFEDGDAVAKATAEALFPLSDEYDEELIEGLRVVGLTQDNVTQAGAETVLEQGIVGMAAKVQLESSLDDVVDAWSHPHMDTFISVTPSYEVREEDGDRDCFLAKECEAYSYEGWREVDMGILGTGEQLFRRSFRRTLLDDGSSAVIVRELIPQGIDSDSTIFKMDAQFAYAILREHDGGTQRIEAFWVDAEVIGIELPDYFALEMAVDQMNATAEEVDAFIAQ